MTEREVHALIKGIARVLGPVLQANRASLDMVFRRVGFDVASAPHNKIEIAVRRPERRVSETHTAAHGTGDGASAESGLTALGVHRTRPEEAGKPHIRFRGPWSPDEAYSLGHGVLHRGVGWRCKSSSVNVEPGSGAAAAESWEKL